MTIQEMLTRMDETIANLNALGNAMAQADMTPEERFTIARRVSLASDEVARARWSLGQSRRQEVAR